MSTIRCYINACRGGYAVEDDHREVFRHNMANSAAYFFYVLDYKISCKECFVLTVCFYGLFVVF